MILPPLTLLSMCLAVLAHTAAAIFFKVASQQSGWRIYFYIALGAGVGFFNPLFTSFAFSNTNPCVVLVLMGIFGGLFFVFTLRWVFHQPLSATQWLAIALLIIGGTLVVLTPDMIPS